MLLAGRNLLIPALAKPYLLFLFEEVGWMVELRPAV
jgi:hypothetical protein